MTMVDRLCAVSSGLPLPAQAELLDFAEFLQQKNRSSSKTASQRLQSLAGGLENSPIFAASPMSIQESLRREWD